jgi:hypothetical protein
MIGSTAIQAARLLSGHCILDTELHGSTVVVSALYVGWLHAAVQLQQPQSAMATTKAHAMQEEAVKQLFIIWTTLAWNCTCGYFECIFYLSCQEDAVGCVRRTLDLYDATPAMLDSHISPPFGATS